MNTGERIKKLRKEKGVKQIELAKAMKSHSAVISVIESGKGNPTSEMAIELSNFFNVSIDYLLTGKEGINDISEEEMEILSVIRDDKAMRNAMIEVAKVKKKAISFTRSYAAVNQNAAIG